MNAGMSHAAASDEQQAAEPTTSKRKPDAESHAASDEQQAAVESLPTKSNQSKRKPDAELHAVTSDEQQAAAESSPTTSNKRKRKTVASGGARFKCLKCGNLFCVDKSFRQHYIDKHLEGGHKFNKSVHQKFLVDLGDGDIANDPAENGADDQQAGEEPVPPTMSDANVQPDDDVHSGDSVDFFKPPNPDCRAASTSAGHVIDNAGTCSGGDHNETKRTQVSIGVQTDAEPVERSTVDIDEVCGRYTARGDAIFGVLLEV